MARIGWRAVVRCSAGSVALELLTFVWLRLRLNVASSCVPMSDCCRPVAPSQLTGMGGCLFHVSVAVSGVFLFSGDFLLPGERSDRGRGHPCFLDDPGSAHQSRGR